jgi:Domain of unknown function (DUF4263)
MNYYQAKITEINYYIQHPTESNIQKIIENIIHKDSDTYSKHFIPHYCASSLLSLGSKGIDLLRELVNKDLGPIRTTALIEVIFSASAKRKSNINFFGLIPDESIIIYPTITNEIANYALNIVHELVNESLVNRDLFTIIITLLSYDTLRNGEDDFFFKHVFNTIKDSSIKINKRVLNKYESLILNPDIREEDCQLILKQNPALIDPLAKDVLSKQKLGTEFITDFILRKLNDEYILVEIEKPGTPLFTKTNDFTSQFTHALGQVLDFQEWVESNISYAQTLMPGILSPTGLLVIGLSNNLSEFQKKKLRRFNINNQGRLKVITFDDLLENAKKLYINMLDSPSML